jgi:hypothetical protein
VAPKVAGSSPVGHPLGFPIGKPNTWKVKAYESLAKSRYTPLRVRMALQQAASKASETASISPEVSAAIISAAALVLVAVIGAALSRYFDRRQRIESDRYTCTPQTSVPW